MGNRNVGIKLNGYLLPRDFFCFISVTDTKLVWDVRHGCQSELSFYCARNSACVFGRNVIKSQKEKYRTKCGSYFEFSHTGTFMRRRTGNDGEWVCQHRREKWKISSSLLFPNREPFLPGWMRSMRRKICTRGGGSGKSGIRQWWLIYAF